MGNQHTQQASAKRTDRKNQPVVVQDFEQENFNSNDQLGILKKQAEELSLSAVRDIEDYECDVGAEIRKRAESSLAALRQALSGNDSGEIQLRMENLSDALQQLGDETYEDIQQEVASTTMEQEDSATDKATDKKQDKEKEKSYPKAAFAAKLRNLADAIENDERFRIQVAGEKIHVPVGAQYSIEYEREENEEEIEFQIKWKRR